MNKAELTLTIKKKWLQKIVSGEKIEEYRDSKEYYHKIFKEFDFKTFHVINPPKTIKLFVPYQKHTFYCIIEVEKIVHEKFEIDIPEGLKMNDLVYTIYIKNVLEHNL